MDLVPHDEADAFVTGPDVRLGRRTAFDEDRRFTGGSRTGEEGREVEAVSAQDPEVEPAAPVVLLAAYPDFLEFADLTGRDQLLHDVDDGVIAVPMRDGEPHALFGAELHDLIGFGQGADEWFLDVDALHARFDRGDDHVPMLMDVSRADGRDIRLSLREHEFVVGVSLYAAEPLGRVRQPLGIGVRDGDDPGLGNLQPDGILTVAVVALAGMADDPDGQRTLLRLSAKQYGGQSQSGGSEEISTFHATC